MKPISKRAKKIPTKPGQLPNNVIEELMTKMDINEPITLPPHKLRKKELSILHGIPENHIFVDPTNGVELYKTSYGTWATSPGY